MVLNGFSCRSQSHIMLLKPKQHCELALDVFGGVDALSKIYSAATALLVKAEIDFDSQIAFKLQCLVSVSVQIVKTEA